MAACLTGSIGGANQCRLTRPSRRRERMQRMATYSARVSAKLSSLSSNGLGPQSMSMTTVVMTPTPMYDRRSHHLPADIVDDCRATSRVSQRQSTSQCAAVIERLRREAEKELRLGFATGKAQAVRELEASTKKSSDDVTNDDGAKLRRGLMPLLRT